MRIHSLRAQNFLVFLECPYFVSAWKQPRTCFGVDRWFAQLISAQHCTRKKWHVAFNMESSWDVLAECCESHGIFCLFLFNRLSTSRAIVELVVWTYPFCLHLTCHLGTFASVLIAKTQIQLLTISEVAVPPSLFELSLRTMIQTSFMLAAVISFCVFVKLLVGDASAWWQVR